MAGRPVLTAPRRLEVDATHPIRWTSRLVLQVVLSSLCLVTLSVLVAAAYAWDAVHGGPWPTVLGAVVPPCGGALLAYGFSGFLSAQRRRQTTPTQRWACGVGGACLAVAGMVLPLYLL